MKKTIPLVLVLALGLAAVCLAAEDTWTSKADMPTPRTHLSTSVVDDKIYAIGGSPGSSWDALSTVEVYDPVTDTWTTRANIPTPRWGLTTSVVDGRIYAIGGAQRRGGNGLSTVEAYDPATDTWTRKADMPTPRLDLGSCVVDGKVYVIGGANRWGGRALSAVEAYDPVTDTWTKIADMPVGRSALSTSTVDGKIYAIGGLSGPPGSYVRVLPVGEYDPVTDMWTPKTDMLTQRDSLSTVVVERKIYAIGGATWPGVIGLSTMEMYDPMTDRWVPKADMPTARWLTGNCASVVDSKIYVIGGTTGPPYNGLSTVEEYDPNPLVVDFNGDGIVDCADMCIMVDHWGEDYPLCDIAPSPWGDGIVDVHDLIVLAEHLFEEVPPAE